MGSLGTDFQRVRVVLPNCGRENGGKQSVGLIFTKLVRSCLKLVPGTRNLLPYVGFRLISNRSVSDEVRILFVSC